MTAGMRTARPHPRSCRQPPSGRGNDRAALSRRYNCNKKIAAASTSVDGSTAGGSPETLCKALSTFALTSIDVHQNRRSGARARGGRSDARPFGPAAALQPRTACPNRGAYRRFGQRGSPKRTPARSPYRAREHDRRANDGDQPRRYRVRSWGNGAFHRPAPRDFARRAPWRR